MSYLLTAASLCVPATTFQRPQRMYKFASSSSLSVTRIVFVSRLHPGILCEMMTTMRRQETPKVNPASLFRLLSEFVLLLLGGLLILLSISGRVGLPARPTALTLLGILFIYSAVRAWMQRQPDKSRLQTHIRASSLVLVGIVILGIPFFPVRDTSLLLGIAGVLLVFRGLIGGLLFLRPS